jgi:oxygen-dependent protoporphyrinogen oxidase
VRRVAVLGGGMAGLAAAWEIRQRGDAEALVLEAGPTFGGKLRSEAQPGFVFEEGPDSFLVRKTAAVTLIRELGIEEELVPITASGQGSAIYSGGRLHPIPPGLMLGLPTEIWPFLRSGLLSTGAKLRALGDLFAGKEAGDGDQPLGPFVARRVGKQVVQRLVEPLLSGIYAGDVAAMSTEATFPQLLELARKDGSLLRGARRMLRKTPRPAEPKAPMFMTLRHGLGLLPQALCANLPKEWLQPMSRVAEIRSAGEGYQVILEDGREMEADGVIVALPAPAAAHALKEIAPQTALALFSIPYASLAVAALTFAPEDVPRPLRGSGFLVPRDAGLHITACTYVVNKWPHESEGGVLLRCYLGRANESPLAGSDEEILAAVQEDLRHVLGITAEPRLGRIFRWPDGMPQYTVGHPARIAAARAGIAEHPRVRLCGAAYDGVGIPDVIRQGREAAAAVLEALADNADAAEEESTRQP